MNAVTSTAPSVAASGPSETRRHLSGATWSLGVYLLLSICLFGLPVIAHFGSHIIAVDDGDPSVIMYWFAWWPHALLHGINPFTTHAILYPQGYNLEWATSMPLPSIVLAPVTLGFGPAVTWNVVELLAPALSAWTAFLLCRNVVGRSLPALVGGYFFGFSPYMLAHLQTSPNLAFVALVPVFVLLVLKRMQGALTTRRYVVLMTLAIAGQYLISSEVLVGAALFGAISLVVAYLLLPQHRAGLRDAVKWLLLAFACAIVLISPFLYYFLFGAQYPPGHTDFPADLVSFGLPPADLLLKVHGNVPFLGSDLEEYLGVPLIVLVLLFAWQRRRDRRTILLLVAAVVAELLAMGQTLVVRGTITSIPLPFRLLRHLPLLRYTIPTRFALFATLPIAVILAIWLNEARPLRRPAALRWGLAALAIAFIVPAVGNAGWNTPIHDPAFFTDGAYKRYLTSRDHVLTIPFWGRNQRWVADAGFPFTLSAGSGGQGEVPAYTRYPVWRTMNTYPFALPPHYGSALRSFLAAKDVTAIVVEQDYPGPWLKLFGTLGIKPIVNGGVLLYRVRPAPAA
jgi:hypothetical protein